MRMFFVDCVVVGIWKPHSRTRQGHSPQYTPKHTHAQQRIRMRIKQISQTILTQKVEDYIKSGDPPTSRIYRAICFINR